MKSLQMLRAARDSTARSVQVFLRDVGNGLLEISHNSLALLGLAVVVALVFVAGRPDLRHQTEVWALDWLQERHEARTAADDDLTVAAAEPDAVERATAVNPKELTPQQAALAKWISRRYNVALEPIGRLVQEAWAIGHAVGLDPTLILAIAAIESRFNPFAQSAMGAQGLMQVMTRVHVDKYEPFGGTHAAFDPISNLKVGVQVLRECIARAGGLEAGLRWYVGAANTDDDGGYIGKVLAEQTHMKRVASGTAVPLNAPNSVRKAPVPAQEAAATPAAPEAGTPATVPTAGTDQVALAR
ncbi:MAG: lytic transglycosylase domain-containing protein [Burkholderiales bacterium]|nr:lytic transglycosylase domain-containing protein [Burkholderiales bacterium]